MIQAYNSNVIIERLDPIEQASVDSRKRIFQGSVVSIGPLVNTHEDGTRYVNHRIKPGMTVLYEEGYEVTSFKVNNDVFYIVSSYDILGFVSSESC